MIEIWQEYSKFQPSGQRLADQDRTIIKKSWFFDLEIIESQQKVNFQQGKNILPDTSIINKQKQPNPNEPPTSENGNPT